jgi:archaemetzincin
MIGCLKYSKQFDSYMLTYTLILKLKNMKAKQNLFYLFYLVIIISSCNSKKNSSGLKKTEHYSSEKDRKIKTIIIQPFQEFSQEDLSFITKQLKQMYPKVIVEKPIKFPVNAFYAPRNRYKADSLIKFLSNHTDEGYISIGLTIQDISTKKDDIKDWGVMGLGYCPGKACVVSSYRIKGKNRQEKIFKVVAHEFGHTLGLQHCSSRNCLMRDAEGKDHLDEEREFCADCRLVLSTEGWKIN